LFKTLTVLENILLGRHRYDRAGFLSSGLQTISARREQRRAREKATAYLDLFGLADSRDRLAGRLPLGQQRYVEICRALAAEPKLLLLDEPTAGLNDKETDDFRDLVFMVHNLGVTLFVIEHHMKFIMEVCDDIAVLNFGKLIAEGPPSRIQDSPVVIEAYLGTEADFD
jgi:branched-chain amino acid transport system ATP-binding protein